MEEQYVDENFEIKTRRKEDVQVELEKVEATEAKIQRNLDAFVTPEDFRTKLRTGEGKLESTSGVCPGFQQANLAFIPNENVTDFAEFCRLNPGPLPVLHRSYEADDFNAEPLTHEYSDARTDAAGYEVYIAGNRQEPQKYLLPAAKYENMQVFYLGCSFGFEKALMDNGVAMRNIDQGRNVSMYRTNIKMNQVNQHQMLNSS